MNILFLFFLFCFPTLLKNKIVCSSYLKTFQNNFWKQFIKTMKSTRLLSFHMRVILCYILIGLWENKCILLKFEDTFILYCNLLVNMILITVCYNNFIWITTLSRIKKEKNIFLVLISNLFIQTNILIKIN